MCVWRPLPHCDNDARARQTPPTRAFALFGRAIRFYGTRSLREYFIAERRGGGLDLIDSRSEFLGWRVCAAGLGRRLKFMDSDVRSSHYAGEVCGSRGEGTVSSWANAFIESMWLEMVFIGLNL